MHDRDPELADFVAALEADGFPGWSALSPDAARRLEDEVFTEPGGPPVDVVRDVGFDGPDGEVPVRVYRHGAGPKPVLVFYHGGGWVLGTLDSVDGVCRRFARRADCVVVSVDYRLAPEHPFPAAVDDAAAALEWAVEHVDRLGGDPDTVAVGGTSAGGGLAAATALRVAEFGGPDLAGQVLCYPALDPSMETDSYERHADDTLLTGVDMAWFWDHYLRSPVDAANPYAAPMEADGDALSAVADAVVCTAGHDVLRDEGDAYAARLADAGVAADHLTYPTLGHGFLSVTDDVSRADEAFDEVAAAVQSLWSA